ncbi:MAB_1171c family putative transporter [Amycolatopsis sp. cg9]|uniref:MAB_1171c family putative transporter n=1 Tax=Amycolatopsis sp. cg9 TaxID=3238801 RepID=UPI003525684E
MVDLLAYLCSALTLAGAAAKILSTRGISMSTSRKYLVAAMVCFALALAVTAPATLAAARWLEPVDNSVRLLGNALAMGAAFCLIGVLNHAGAGPDARRRSVISAAALAGCVAAMAILLALADTDYTPQFAATYGRDPRIVAYLTLYVAFMSWGLISFLALMRRYVRARELHPLLRTGFRIVLGAAILGLVWAAWKGAGVVVLAVTGHALPLQAEIAEGLALLSIGVGTAGATFTSWWPALRNLPVRWQVWHATRRLTPLWRQVVEEVMPQVQLDEPEQGRLTRAERTEYRLYRRTLEIRDAQLALRPYIPPQIPGWALAAARERGLSPVAGDVLLEAAELGAALDAYRAGRRHHPEVVDVVMPQHSPATPDLLAEARWLIQVAAMLRRDPDVAALRGRAAVTAAHDSPGDTPRAR